MVIPWMTTVMGRIALVRLGLLPMTVTTTWASLGSATHGLQIPECRWLGIREWRGELHRFAVAEGARVLSNSWGGGGHSQALYDAIARARDAGVLFVAAAGNSATDTDSQPHYPVAMIWITSYRWLRWIARGDLASWSISAGIPSILGRPASISILRWRFG